MRAREEGFLSERTAASQTLRERVSYILIGGLVSQLLVLGTVIAVWILGI